MNKRLLENKARIQHRSRIQRRQSIRRGEAHAGAPPFPVHLGIQARKGCLLTRLQGFWRSPLLPGGAGLPGAGRQVAGDRTGTAPGSDKTCCFPPRAHQRRAVPAPSAKAMSRFGCSRSCRHCTFATDGARGWACSQSPPRRNKRLADSMSRPETAQATVVPARAGLLLERQAALGRIPSLMGLQQSLITTCVRAAGR